MLEMGVDFLTKKTGLDTVDRNGVTNLRMLREDSTVAMCSPSAATPGAPAIGLTASSASQAQKLKPTEINVRGKVSTSKRREYHRDPANNVGTGVAVAQPIFSAAPTRRFRPTMVDRKNIPRSQMSLRQPTLAGVLMPALDSCESSLRSTRVIETRAVSGDKRVPGPCFMLCTSEAGNALHSSHISSLSRVSSSEKL